MNTRKNTAFANQRFEFLLKINGKPIVGRLFNIEKYNSDVLSSLELKQLVDNIAGMNNDSIGSCGLIPKYLKDKSVDFIWNRYDPYNLKVESETMDKNIFKNEDIFTFEIKVDKRVVASTIFSGNWFPTFVRYQVNIKEIIPNIIEEITECFSRKKYKNIKELV